MDTFFGTFDCLAGTKPNQGCSHGTDGLDVGSTVIARVAREVNAEMATFPWFVDNHR